MLKKSVNMKHMTISVHLSKRTIVRQLIVLFLYGMRCETFYWGFIYYNSSSRGLKHTGRGNQSLNHTGAVQTLVKLLKVSLIPVLVEIIK